jgi:hypothetical protein
MNQTPENIGVHPAQPHARSMRTRFWSVPHPVTLFHIHWIANSYITVTETWPAFEACHNRGSVGGDGGSAAIVRGIEAQWSFMDGFSAHGIDNPAKAVMSKGFWEYLVKGIIKDDLPYSLGEKAGMSKLFEYVLPRGIATPSHQTVWRDLDILYEKLDEKLNKELKVSTLYMHHMHVLTLVILAIQSNKSKIVITSDLWTSKNSVYAFAGVVTFWIDDNWDLHKCVLDLLPLSGDHLGKASGKLIFKALRRQEIEIKLSECSIVGMVMQIIISNCAGANTTNNAPSNGPLNHTLSKYLWKISKVHINPENMQVGCGGHILNISAQCVLSAFMSTRIDTDDCWKGYIFWDGDCRWSRHRRLLHKSTRLPDHFPNDDPEVAEEMRIVEAELKKGGDDSEDENIEGSMEESSSENGDDGGVEEGWADKDEDEPTTGQAKRKRKILSSVDKVHTVIQSLF